MRLEYLIILLICLRMTSSSQLELSHIHGTRLVKDNRKAGHDILHVEITNHRDYYLLGQYVINSDVIDVSNVTLPIARKKGNEGYLEEPLSFSLMARQGGESGCLRYWKMNCPLAYETMSVVASLCGNPPDTSHYACVFDHFTRPYQLEYYKVAETYKRKATKAEIWKFVSYEHEASFYFIYNQTTSRDDDNVIKDDARDVTPSHAIDPEPKFGISLRHGSDDGTDDDEFDLIRGRSFKPRYAIVSVDVPDDVFNMGGGGGNPQPEHNDVTTTALIIVSSLFAFVGVATYFVKQRRKGSADTSSVTSSDKTSVLQQMPSSASTRHHNINISYTGGPDDDDDVTPMTSRPRASSEQQVAVVNPYMDGSVEELPSFNDVTSRYHHQISDDGGRHH